MPKYEDPEETAAGEAAKAATPQRNYDGHSCQSGHPEDKEVTARGEAVKAKTKQGANWADKAAASKGGQLER